MNIEKSGGRQKSENGSRERYGDERKMASKKKKKRKKGKGNLERKKEKNRAQFRGAET